MIPWILFYLPLLHIKKIKSARSQTHMLDYFVWDCQVVITDVHCSLAPDLPRNLVIKSDTRNGLNLAPHEQDVICLVKRNAADDFLAQDSWLWFSGPTQCKSFIRWSVDSHFDSTDSDENPIRKLCLRCPTSSCCRFWTPPRLCPGLCEGQSLLSQRNTWSWPRCCWIVFHQTPADELLSFWWI